MLEFLRKYQRYFFFVITIVIIISFSFFGTYSTINVDYPQEQTVLTVTDGTDIKRQELNDMTVFINSDLQDKLILEGIWGPNFLNDGVIRKDFLETGLGYILAMNYPEDLSKDLRPRLEKEKRTKLYSNPQAGFISVESAWSYFMPDMKFNYDLIRSANNPTDPEVLAARIALFLQEKQFSAPLLKQVLRYQEKQYSWLPPDQNLDYYDLSLFGYHTLEDWFGPRFTQLVAQFIINSAKIAEQKGYKVTKEEAWADLMQHAAISYKQNMENPRLGVANLQQYVDEQLRRMNMDQNKATNLWRDILLFRRLFKDVGNSVVVDPFSIKKIQEYAKEGIVGQLFELPKELRFDSYRSMQKLETYLNAVAKRDDKNLLTPPTTFLSVDEVAKKFPELIQYRYILSVAVVNKNQLQTKVGLKETWDWELADKNWDILKKKFPELAVKKGSTSDERFAVLESLDDKTRGQVDAFARASFVDSHPEWIEQALDNATPKEGEIALFEKGGKIPFAAGEKRQEVISLLNKASLKGEPPNEASQKLAKYTPDQATYYRIAVIKKAPGREIVTFKEADEQGVLDALLDQDLEAFYVKIRGQNATQYQKSDGSWKALADVRDLVADQYFDKIRQAIEKDYTKAIAPQVPPTLFLGDYLASLRFYAYMRNVRDQLAKDIKNEAIWISNTSSSQSSQELIKREDLADQWKLIKTAYQATRGDINSHLNGQEIFAMKLKTWSQVHTPANGDINFFYLDQREVPQNATPEKVEQLHQVISTDAQRIYMQKLLFQLKDKKAMSLDYMDRSHSE